VIRRSQTTGNLFQSKFSTKNRRQCQCVSVSSQNSDFVSMETSDDFSDFFSSAEEQTRDNLNETRTLCRAHKISGQGKKKSRPITFDPRSRRLQINKNQHKSHRGDLLPKRFASQLEDKSPRWDVTHCRISEECVESGRK